MSAIIHFINLYAQSGGAVTASAAKAGQDAFVRDWMAAAKSGGATRGRLGNKPPPTQPRSDFLSRRRGWGNSRAKRSRGNKPPPRQPGSLAADARRKASLAPPKAPPPLVKRWLADPTPAATHWSYRAGKAGGSGGIYGTQRIPRTIVQTSGILANVAMDERRWSRGWRRHNPEYEYLLLDDYACRGFVMRHAALHERHAFNAVATGAQRADLFRAYWLREVPPPPRNSAAAQFGVAQFGANLQLILGRWAASTPTSTPSSTRRSAPLCLATRRRSPAGGGTFRSSRTSRATRSSSSWRGARPRRCCTSR